MLDTLTAFFQPPPPDRVLTLPVALFGLLCLAGFVGGVLLTRPDAEAFARRFGNPKVVPRHAATLARLCGVGLVLLGTRILQIDPLTLAAPLWLLVCFLAIAAYAARIVRAPR